MKCGPYVLDLGTPRVMAIVNVTPDSFSGDGLLRARQSALERIEQLIAAGADIIDIGGESTRPGATPVPEDEELERVIPVIEQVSRWGVPLSVDTFKPAVMRAAIRAGVAIINDIRALEAPGALEAVAASEAGVCLMHMQGMPETMQQSPRYADVLDEVRRYLAERAACAQAAGIAAERIMLDPGFGFGKTLAHNYALLAGLERFTALGFPVLAGLSRKSMLGGVTGKPAGERVVASVAGALLAAERGARILRVHDVAETCEALAIWRACREAAQGI